MNQNQTSLPVCTNHDLNYQWFKQLREDLVAEGEDARKAQEETRKGVVLLEESFTKCSGGRNFFGGDKIGYLDIAFGCFLPWISVVDKLCRISLIDESKTPNLFKWATYFCADAAVKDLLPDIGELYDFAKLLASVIKGSAPDVAA